MIPPLKYMVNRKTQVKALRPGSHLFGKRVGAWNGDGKVEHSSSSRIKDGIPVTGPDDGVFKYIRVGIKRNPPGEQSDPASCHQYRIGYGGDDGKIKRK